MSEAAGGESPAAVVLRRLAGVLDEVAVLDLHAESERELCEATVGLQAEASRLDAQRLRLVDRVDRREAYREDACVTVGSWLRWRSRLDHGTSIRLTQAAPRRAQLPAMTAALEAGDITLSHLLVATAALAKAAVRVVTTMGPWRITHVGRRFRTLPPWLRPCVEALHRHCRGPGCDRPFSWAQVCHQTDWGRRRRDGGG